MFVKEFVKQNVDLLKNSGIESPTIDLRYILSYFYNVRLSEIYNILEKNINNNELTELNNIIKQRLEKKPISKIFNKKFFWDYEFFVNTDVLDPRGDSEVMIEDIIKNYNCNDKLKILDLGTGSGCLIITLLKNFTNSTGLAVDINEKSILVAEKNAKNLGVFDRLELRKNNWNDNINKKFDIIISNPPYIPTNDINKLEDDVKNFDPILALDGGRDGLNCYRYISKNIGKNFNNNTKLYLEIGHNQKQDVINIFKNDNFVFEYSIKDYNNIERILKFKK